nr:hypothetical protein CFP56_01189 [Quercus suber]
MTTRATVSRRRKCRTSTCPSWLTRRQADGMPVAGLSRPTLIRSQPHQAYDESEATRWTSHVPRASMSPGGRDPDTYCKVDTVVVEHARLWCPSARVKRKMRQVKNPTIVTTANSPFHMSEQGMQPEHCSRLMEIPGAPRPDLPGSRSLKHNACVTPIDCCRCFTSGDGRTQYSIFHELAGQRKPPVDFVHHDVQQILYYRSSRLDAHMRIPRRYRKRVWFQAIDHS